MASTNHPEGAPAGRLLFSRNGDVADRGLRARFSGSGRARCGRLLRTGVRLAASAFLLACSVQLWTACNKKESAGGDPEVEAGRALYLSHCIACHNVNPAQDGSLGPAIKGSPLELVQARVLRGEYPPGYKPKRTTHIMVRLPLTEEDVAKIHKFLNAP